jgi:hypothetical protein
LPGQNSRNTCVSRSSGAWAVRLSQRNHRRAASRRALPRGCVCAPSRLSCCRCRLHHCRRGRGGRLLHPPCPAADASGTADSACLSGGAERGCPRVGCPAHGLAVNASWAPQTAADSTADRCVSFRVFGLAAGSRSNSNLWSPGALRARLCESHNHGCHGSQQRQR